MSTKTEPDENQHTKLQLAFPWIDADLFAELLSMDFPTEDIVVKNYLLKAALATGENYCSLMIRAAVNYTLNGVDSQKKFIIKTASAGNGLEEKIASEMKEMFDQEISAYADVLTKVNDLLKGIGEQCRLHGRCYATNKEKPYLIFEDLSENGFKNIDRRTGLDIPHFKLVLNILAKYHAATAVLVEKEPSLKTMFNEHRTVTGSEFLSKMIKHFVIAKRKFCEKQPGLEQLAEKFAKIEDKIYDRLCAACTSEENDFNVILHGDLWSNNIMFKYNDNGDVVDTVLVDFQLCSYGPPVLDVTYTLYTSSNSDIEESDFDMLAQYYYDELKSTLTKLNYSKNIPSLAEFNNQIILKGIYGAYIGVICEAGRVMENVGEDGVSVYVNDDAAECRLNMLLNPIVQPKIVKLLKYFDRRGYYEIK